MEAPHDRRRIILEGHTRMLVGRAGHRTRECPAQQRSQVVAPTGFEPALPA